jgi:hypothetical protein
MLKCRLAALGFVALLLASRWSNAPDPHDLHGVWEIVAVERQGLADSSAVGYHMTFKGNALHFSVSPNLYYSMLADESAPPAPPVNIEPLDQETLNRISLYS